MTESYIKISELIYKEIIGTISSDEKKELEVWVSDSDGHRTIYENLSDRTKISTGYDEYRAVHRAEVWKSIEKQIRGRSLFLHRVMRWGVAASIIFCLGGIALLYNKVHVDEKVTLEMQEFSSVTPGCKRAVLKLASGKVISLPDSNIIFSGGVSEIHKVDNELVYRNRDEVSVEQWNTLIVPKGGEFSINLSDGTRVWLNADSKLSYPEVFLGSARRVTLVGEGYFEVKGNVERPFIVNTNGMDVKVLGTKFNIRSFAEDGRVITTLLEGCVELSGLGKTTCLFPDQQAIFQVGNNSLEVMHVDADDYCAWTLGQFVFRRERLESIMDELSRWYDVSVFYQNEGAKNLMFSGKINRYGNISEILSIIEKTNKVRFKLLSNSIVVLENHN